MLLLSFQAPTMSMSPTTHAGSSLSKIIVSPEQEQTRQQSTPHLCPVQKLLRKSDTFTWCANNKNNAENNRPMHKWNFKKTDSVTSGYSKNNVIKKSIGPHSEYIGSSKILQKLAII